MVWKKKKMIQFANEKNITQTDIWVKKLPSKKKRLKIYVLLKNNQPITYT